MKAFTKHSTKDSNPSKPGWYNTNKGELFYDENLFASKNTNWSCRDDRLSEEYPSVWYEEILNPDKQQELFSWNDLKKECIGIVNQLYDLANVDSAVRQQINDRADDYLFNLFRQKLSGASVGGEVKEFLDYVDQSRHDFVTYIKALDWDNKLRTEVDTLMICFDQMKNRLESTQQRNDGWVDVSVRLPERGVRVLVLFGEIDNVLIGRRMNDSDGNDVWMIYFSDGEKPNQGSNAEIITHWQPLPTKP